LSLSGVERLVGVLMKMLQTTEMAVRHRAVNVLALTTNSWPTMDPSRLMQNKYGTSLLVTAQVRHWLLHILKNSRSGAAEQLAMSILDGLCSADFRDLYPNIEDGLESLKCSSLGTRVYEVFQALAEFYPTGRYNLNERWELTVYAHYMSREHGVGQMMERLCGPRMNKATVLAKALKRGTRHSNFDLSVEWYPSDTEVFERD
jgi:hypothetical protein